MVQYYETLVIFTLKARFAIRIRKKLSLKSHLQRRSAGCQAFPRGAYTVRLLSWLFFFRS